MSMKYHPVQRIGIYLEMDDLAPYCKSHEIDPDALAEENGLLILCDMEGTCCAIKEGEPGVRDEFRAEESFYFLEVDKYPSLFRPVYETYETALHALKEQVAELLPENFDYDKNFVEFFGVTFG